MAKSQALYTFTLVSASVATTMLMIQACGGGGGGFGNAFAAGETIVAPDPIVGVWDSTATGKDCNTGAALASFKGFGMFNAGGTASFDNSRPPTSQGSAFGTWKRESGSDYTLTLVFMRFNPDGTLAGTQKAKVTRTLSADGNSYTGTIAGQIIDAAGNVTASYCATDSGSRVTW
ncbi:hypothetical protein QTI24_02935 [Variovorax sp. J22P240]|uniref:hypothetical protein n=1 Tax=unclassified Variovorax TaxID=663243 RepID=UPI0025759BEF|nr:MULTISPECIES: hypothetical protein [unclassified Variovorax]MDL9997543.1 hypothetical protein [Variovorax sp. J22P240]MDM0051579.1 hypothetical protein [Variovorax sp. J22R115]